MLHRKRTFQCNKINLFYSIIKSYNDILFIFLFSSFRFLQGILWGNHSGIAIQNWTLFWGLGIYEMSKCRVKCVLRVVVSEQVVHKEDREWYVILMCSWMRFLPITVSSLASRRIPQTACCSADVEHSARWAECCRSTSDKESVHPAAVEKTSCQPNSG